MDDTKPDLLIHSMYINALKNYHLSDLYNVININDLKVETHKFKDVFVIADTYVAPVELTLRPFYTPTLDSGIEPAATSYTLERPTKIYKIERNLPRYIIWTKNDPLLVCGTIVDRIEHWELFEAFQRAKDWAYTINRYKSIAVFDLDKTLISDECVKIQESERLLTYAKREYDYVVLWSHGSALHVDEQLAEFRVGNANGVDVFDLVIHTADTKSPKNLLYLYNHFPYVKFTKSILVDDLVANWTPEYDKFLIPYNNTTLHQALYIL